MSWLSSDFYLIRSDFDMIIWFSPILIWYLVIGLALLFLWSGFDLLIVLISSDFDLNWVWFWSRLVGDRHCWRCADGGALHARTRRTPYYIDKKLSRYILRMMSSFLSSFLSSCLSSFLSLFRSPFLLSFFFFLSFFRTARDAFAQFDCAITQIARFFSRRRLYLRASSSYVAGGFQKAYEHCNRVPGYILTGEKPVATAVAEI